jgi:hypothetical protein
LPEITPAQLKVYITWDGDGIGRMVGRAELADSPDKIRKISQQIDAGNEIFRSWCERTRGEVIGIGGDEGRIAIDATKLAELPGICETYESAAGATVSVGVGMKLSESAKALLVAKLRGKNRIVLYTPDLEPEIKRAVEAHDKESAGSKEVEEYLKFEKAEEQAPEAPKEQQMPPLKKEKSLEDHFHDHAAAKATGTRHETAIKRGLMTALNAVKQQLPQIEQIKQQNPDLYMTIMGISQELILIAKDMFGKPESSEVAKAEGGLVPPPAAGPGLHSTVEGFMGGLRALPKGSPARGKFITSHMNHAPFLSALKAHPQGPQVHQMLTQHLNSAANAGFKPNQSIVSLTKDEPKEEIDTSKAPQTPKEYVGDLGWKKVFLVDGSFIRDYVDIEFTEGGNHGRYDWIPVGQIWLENSHNEMDVAACALHEYLESDLMHGGMSYDDAHDHASAMERVFRTSLGENKVVKLPQALEWLKTYTKDRKLPCSTGPFPADKKDMPMAKSQVWSNKEGIKIPRHGTPERAQYNRKYAAGIRQGFPGTLKPVKIPLTAINPGSGNMAVNKERLGLYTRMARGGDPLPPVVVRRTGKTFDMVDGSHRQAAAQAAGLTHLYGYEHTPADTKKAEAAHTHPAVSGGRYAILTGENPMHKVTSPGGSAGIETELQNHGLKYEHVKGHYGSPENSILVHNPDLEHMKDLGHRYGQDSILHSQGGKAELHYTNGPHAGKVRPSTGPVQTFDTPPADNFTTVDHGGTPVHFSWPFDFGSEPMAKASIMTEQAKNSKAATAAIQSGEAESVGAADFASSEQMEKRAPFKPIGNRSTNMKYLPGSIKNGKIKIIEPDTGKPSWKGVRSGMIRSNDNHPISSREPNGK